MFTKAHQTVKDNRPDIHQDKGDQDHQERDQYRHQSPSAEEGECFRQLDVAEAVIDLRRQDTDQNTDKTGY
ncbi:Uncharacterised protein [Pantoea agglomerans]|uniref:Uncharacterized protein n=1 Tax=Enterobacter agglomerans TaxID=549 RepID=A0A379AJ84_ENTAG|nr:Uncharacterised protein [Pantoea agglomerans]